MAAAFGRALAACGRDPDPGLVDRLVQADAELIVTHTEICPDTVPFVEAVRREGIRVALVSNCADNTRPMLAAKGLLDLVDAVVLSCEVGSAKPDPEIYLIALRELGAQPADGVMLDDQPRFCAGAEAAGVRAIQVVRPGIASHAADPRFSSVPSLPAALPLMLLSLVFSLTRTGRPPWQAAITEQGQRGAYDAGVKASRRRARTRPVVRLATAGKGCPAPAFSGTPGPRIPPASCITGFSVRFSVYVDFSTLPRGKSFTTGKSFTITHRRRPRGRPMEGRTDVGDRADRDKREYGTARFWR